MKTERNWAIWREYRSGGTTLSALGAKHGVGRARIRQIVMKCGREVKCALSTRLLPLAVLLEDSVREGTLGVEFTFQLDDPFDIYDGWGEWEPLYLGYNTWTWFKVNIPADEGMEP